MNSSVLSYDGETQTQKLRNSQPERCFIKHW